MAFIITFKVRLIHMICNDIKDFDKLSMKKTEQLLVIEKILKRALES